MVGIALGPRQFIQQGLGIFGGAIVDRWCQTDDCYRYADARRRIRHNGYRPLNRGLWFSCLLSGLGGTLFDPPRLGAMVVKLIRPQQRGRFFSRC